MREIKFRVWWTDATMMREVVKWEDGAVSFLVPLMPNSLGQEYELQQLDEDQYELMQYTGLKDKNGKEIYEGDILRWSAWSGAIKDNDFHVSQVWWDDVRTRWAVSGGNIGLGLYETANLTVVGNIYENPDLVKS